MTPSPKSARCTRIRWVRPVASATSRRTASVPNASSTRYRVSARLPDSRPAMRLRSAGRRLIGDRSSRSGVAARPRRSPRRRARVDHAELRGEADMSPVVLGDDQKPAHVLVEPAHHAGPQHTADPRQAARAIGQQRIHRVPRARPGGGCTTRPAGLSSTNMLVLEHHVERARLGLGQRRSRDGQVHRIALLRFDPARSLGYHRVVPPDLTCLDQVLETRARQLRQAARQELVEALTGIVRAGGRGQDAAHDRRLTWTTSRASSRCSRSPAASPWSRARFCSRC